MAEGFDEGDEQLVPLGAYVEGAARAAQRVEEELLERERRRTREPPHVSRIEREVVACIVEHGRPAVAAADEEGLRSVDFWDERLGWIYEAARAVTERGAAVSVTSISDQLARMSKLEKAGGPRGLERLASTIVEEGRETLDGMVDDVVSHPVDAVRTHARLVVEYAQRRRIIDECRRAATAAMLGGTDSAEVLDAALRRLSAVEAGTERRLADNPGIARGLSSSLPALGGKRVVVPTGFTDLDKLLFGGFTPGDLVILAARPSMGKALADHEPVMLPSGLSVPISHLRVGDEVMGSDGNATRVTGVFPQGVVPLFSVRFSDGSSLVTSGDHLWTMDTRHGRRTVRTDDLALAAPGRYRLPLVGRHDFDDFWVPPAFDAYALGVWLGDGTTNGSCAEVCKPEPDVIAMFEAGLSASDCLVRGEDGRCRVVRRKRGRDRSVFMRHLETEGLAGKHSHERFVPLHVLRGSDATRRSVLAGLLDTDGYVTSSGRSVEFSTTSSRMLDGVAFIVRSLGGICSVSGWRRNAYRHRGERRIGRPSARLVITFPDGYIPTRSVKHAARWKQGRRTAHRSVVGVEPVPPGHATCISVAAEDGLFVARDFIVTHNTQMVLDICEKRCLDHGEAVLFFSLEMGAEQLHTRLAGARARANPMREDANRHQQARLMKAIGELAEARLFIDETPGIGIGRLRATARAVVRRERVSLVVVDYLQLITHEKAIDNKATEVGEISKALKALARELRVPVVALSQLNRSVEGRADKRPMMSDLRESGSIEQDADVVILLYREEYYLKGGTPGNKVGVAEASVAKHRNGPTGVVNLHFGRHADDPSDAPPRFGSLARGGRDE